VHPRLPDRAATCVLWYLGTHSTATATAPALPPEVIAYQQAHIHENLGPTVIAVASVLLCLDVTTVAVRFYARRALKISYGWDDWLIIPGLVCSFVKVKENI
jgi:hypothetical protein